MLFTCLSRAQNPYALFTHDTTIAAGAQLRLAIDSTRIFSNFMFSACDRETGRWTIWRKSLTTHKYVPVFKDRYNRAHVRVSADGKEMVYVRYRTPEKGAMHSASLDTAWVCRGATNGEHETVLFMVPQFAKNAIYDIDWSPDRERVLFASGNDAFPTMTRDGDVFEYNITTGSTTNKTNNWELWSKYCRYGPDGRSVAYSHYARFWYARPTDVFLLQPGGLNEQLTNSTLYKDTEQYCTVTDYKVNRLIYRRGELPVNRLFEKLADGEHLLFASPGYGGVMLEQDIFAAADADNNICIFTPEQLIGRIKISAIDGFCTDKEYNYGPGPTADLNWLGRQNVDIVWSTGGVTTAITVQPERTTTYYCTIMAGGVKYRDSVKVRVNGHRPVVEKKCLTLHTSGYAAYQWQLNNTPIAGATDSVYTPEVAGNYMVGCKDKKGGVAVSVPVPVTITESDSVMKLNDAVRIEPEPSSSLIKIIAPFPVNLVVINENGKIVIQKNGATLIDMNDLPDGIFSFLLYDDNCLKLKVRKLRKEK